MITPKLESLIDAEVAQRQTSFLLAVGKQLAMELQRTVARVLSLNGINVPVPEPDKAPRKHARHVRLNDRQKKAMLAKLKAGKSVAEMAKKYHVALSTVHRLKANPRKA